MNENIMNKYLVGECKGLYRPTIINEAYRLATTNFVKQIVDNGDCYNYLEAKQYELGYSTEKPNKLMKEFEKDFVKCFESTLENMVKEK